MALALVQLPGTKIDGKYEADVWKQGDLLTVALPCENVDEGYTNVLIASVDTAKYPNIGQPELEANIKERLDKILSCAHIFEQQLVGGRQAMKCKYCEAERR